MQPIRLTLPTGAVCFLGPPEFALFRNGTWQTFQHSRARKSRSKFLVRINEPSPRRIKSQRRGGPTLRWRMGYIVTALWRRSRARQVGAWKRKRKRKLSEFRDAAGSKTNVNVACRPRGHCNRLSHWRSPSAAANMQLQTGGASLL